MRFSLRTGCKDHLDHAYIERLIACLKDCGNCIDDVWLATSYGIPSKEQYEKEAADMAWAAEKFRAAGITASMQISRTIGHHLHNMLTNGCDGVREEFDVITSWDGVESPGVFCWNNESFRAYVRDELATYAAAFHPSYAWVDDDIRLRLVGNSKALCFCDNCIRLFNEVHGYAYDRATLKADFLSDLTVREQYINYQMKTLQDFAGVISEAVHDASPETVMGLQNGGETDFATNTQRANLDKMREVTGKAPGFRGGCVFYTDHQPQGMFEKALVLHYMNSRLPDYVTTRSCEIENLPFTAYGKSPECTALEAALYLAYGCNEASVTLMRQSEPLEWHARMFERLAQYRPYYNAYTHHNEGTAVGGISIYQSPRAHYAKCDKNGEPFFNDNCIRETHPKLRWGLPIHSAPRGNVYLLTKKACEYLNEDDLKFLAKETVLADADCIERLQELGYAGILKGGVEPLSAEYQPAVYARTTDHPINDGWQYDNQSYFAGIKHRIVGEEIEPLTRCHGYHDGGMEHGVTAALIPTTAGAKWVVTATTLEYIQSSYRNRETLRRALDYVAKTPLPAFVSSPEQMVAVPRVNKEGQTVSVMLLNASLTDSENFAVTVRNPANAQQCTLIDPYGEPQILPLQKRGDDYIVTVPALRAWRVVSILI